MKKYISKLGARFSFVLLTTITIGLVSCFFFYFFFWNRNEEVEHYVVAKPLPLALAYEFIEDDAEWTLRVGGDTFHHQIDEDDYSARLANQIHSRFPVVDNDSECSGILYYLFMLPNSFDLNFRNLGHHWCSKGRKVNHNERVIENQFRDSCQPRSETSYERNRLLFLFHFNPK